MLHVAEQIESAAQAVRERWPKTPRAGIVLGSGLGSLADEIAVDETIDYAEIPNFATSTAPASFRMSSSV